MDWMAMTDDELVVEIETQCDLMRSVATGKPRIDDVNFEYKERRDKIKAALIARSLDDPNPHADLWAWYGRWSKGDMPTWASRRIYVNTMYQPIIDKIKGRQSMPSRVIEEPTGWPRVDRNIYEIRSCLETARTEEQFQNVGLQCREALISVAQVVYDPQKHPSEDGVRPSKTDANGMLKAYIAVELGGGRNEEVRKHAQAALSLANALQHKRTATFREAAISAEATTSVVNLLAIIAGRRDREP